MKFINCLNKIKYFIFFLLFGLFVFCYPMLKSGFDLMPGDGYDIKLFTYILEHSRLWLLHVPTHEHFWSAPFFYPASNTLALSDSAMGIMPLYWLLRVIYEPFSATQALMALMCILNYSTFYYMLKELKFSSLSSSFGAFIFAFSLLRWFRMQHLNYYTQFYTILCLIFLIKLIQQKDISKLKTHVYFALASIFLVVQFYSCYTLAYFFSIFGFLGLIISLFLKNTRETIIEFFKKYLFEIVLYSCFTLLLLVPFIKIYLSIGLLRSLDDMLGYIEGIDAWFQNLSVLDWAVVFDNISQNASSGFESCASIGLVAGLVAFLGIAFVKKMNVLLYTILFFIFLVSCRIGSFVLWKYLFHIIPGAEGMRVIIRCTFISLIILSIGSAAFVEHFKNYKKRALKVLLFFVITLILIEQIPMCNDPNSRWENYSSSKSAFLAQLEQSVKELPKDKDIIEFVPVFNTKYANNPMSQAYYGGNMQDSRIAISELAMWSAIATNKYTLNGYSGFNPKQAPVDENKIYRRIYNINIDKFIPGRYLLDKNYELK